MEAKKGRRMNLTLGFPEPARERTLARQTGLQGAIQHFQEWMANPDSPVRALRHQPARPGEFAESLADFHKSNVLRMRPRSGDRGIQRPRNGRHELELAS